VPNQEVLSLYEAMVQISQKMLEAARHQKWEDFDRLEMLCEGYIHQIPVHNEQLPLSKDALRRKVGLLKQILSNDRQICELTQPWVVKLDNIMGLQPGRGSDGDSPSDFIRK
jgi:flagellar protein FliT